MKSQINKTQNPTHRTYDDFRDILQDLAYYGRNVILLRNQYRFDFLAFNGAWPIGFREVVDDYEKFVQSFAEFREYETRLDAATIGPDLFVAVGTLESAVARAWRNHDDREVEMPEKALQQIDATMNGLRLVTPVFRTSRQKTSTTSHTCTTNAPNKQKIEAVRSILRDDRNRRETKGLPKQSMTMKSIQDELTKRGGSGMRSDALKEIIDLLREDEPNVPPARRRGK